MTIYRNRLPQLNDALYLTDGGIETNLIFHEGLDLPYFAAFHLLKTSEGESALRQYYLTYAELAKRFGSGLVLESSTWRASADWGIRLGYSPEELIDANRSAIQLLENIRGEYNSARTPVVVSGCIGPRFDGYVTDQSMSTKDAEHYHQRQIDILAETSADMICALTLNRSEEAVGIVRAAKRAGMPVAISFTTETDGKLPTGQTLGNAIREVDDATSGYSAYFMINCAHPTHFGKVVRGGEPWVERVRGLRANASKMSHAELNEAAELDDGNPAELGSEYAALRSRTLKCLNVLGGCCGTDHRHIEQIASACLPVFRDAT